jgi:peroxiredoxin Q/BCP
MITIGSKIDTNFTLDIVRNGEIQTVPFSSLLDKPLIVSVYMKNNTGSCDNQNASLAAHADAIQSKGFNLMALSKDGCKSHAKYAEKLGITYILASDPDNLLPAATDSIVEKSMYGKKYMGPSRSAFVIGTDATVLAVIESVDTKNHGEEILNLISTL